MVTFLRRSQVLMLAAIVALGCCTRAVAAPSNIQIEWEHCLLSVLYKYKKPGVEPKTALDQTCVGMSYVRGYIGPKNPARATPLFQRAADAGNPTAMAMLANAYMNGYGVTKDSQRALQLFRQAAALDQTDAILTLGQFAMRGTGVPPDRKAAQAFVKAAADKGNNAAWNAWQHTFGPESEDLNKAVDLYKAGQAARAWPLFRRAADAGNPRAQFQLGWQLDKGEGIKSDPAAAVGWYRKAAAQGDGEAAAALGKLLEDGKGMPEDWIAAAQWYATSAKIGDPMGTFLLGRAYQCGIGVPQNRNEAIEWFWRAEARGHPEGARWGRWLRGVGNDVGVCSQRERDVMGMVAMEPLGVTFRNSNERLAWLGTTHANFERAGAWLAWDKRRRDYANCQGGSNCTPPGPEPPKP